MIPIKRLIGATALCTLIAACAPLVDTHDGGPKLPERFEANLPEAASQEQGVKQLLNWWSQFDDSLVEELISDAEASSPTLTQALSRITEARASSASARSELFPKIDGNGNATRSKSISAPGVNTVSTSTSLSTDASWEIDLFGASRKSADAANTRLSARKADWHDARVSLAAEVVTTLVNYRACILSSEILQQDLTSRIQTGQVTALKIQAGFAALADGTLIDASIADGKQRLRSQQAQCDLYVKALVSLTDLGESVLRSRLAKGRKLPMPMAFAVQAVPAQALAQRPDIASAELEWTAARADVDVTQANRLPRINLLGSIGTAALRSAGLQSDAGTWSFGPAISLPIFDAGRRKADVEAAQARAESAYATYRQKVRSAVREIEEALVRLDSASHRSTDATTSATQYDRFFNILEALYKAGERSLLELEEARRNALAAKQTEIDVQREHVIAWIALYKALGGGWKCDGCNTIAALSPSE